MEGLLGSFDLGDLHIDGPGHVGQGLGPPCLREVATLGDQPRLPLAKSFLPGLG